MPSVSYTLGNWARKKELIRFQLSCRAPASDLAVAPPLQIG